jgi:hypothetical protein
MVGDVAYDRQLDQSMGDTCHHYKGDMWHGMMSAGDWASTVAGYMADTWGIQHSTLGILLLVFEVPRGPVMGCHVAPRGWFMVYAKYYGFHRGRTPDLFYATDWQDRANHPGHCWCLQSIR